RAADQEIIRGLAPIFLEPFDIGFEPAGGRNQRRGPRLNAAVALLETSGKKHAVVDFEVKHFGVIEDLDAEPLGGEIERVQHRPAAAKEERIGAAEAQRAAERRL